MQEIYDILLKSNISKENIFLNEPMSKHTSFKIGGNAKYFIKVYSIDEIKTVLNIANTYNIPLFVLGNGTNILIKDEGFDGIIIQIKMEGITIKDTVAIVDSGVKNSVLSNKLLNNSLTGFEFASGIPGTIGGAITMNAGAYGSEIKDIISEVTYMNYNGEIHKLTCNECKFSYRNSIFKENKYIILQVKLNFTQGDKQEIKDKVNELMKQRKEKQPLEFPSAGSTFKRGNDFITAKIIDECGLKGFMIGGAQVSEKHAGFIINKNNATSKDIIDLVEYVKKTVFEKTNKKIELEIEII